MELLTQPDIYAPSIDEQGNYVDKISAFSVKKGLYCPCGSRKDKIYDSYSIFSAHTKTKMHKKWLENLNLNKANYYIENEKQKEIIQNQRLIIAKLEKDINTKIMTIDYLTQQIHNMQPIKNNVGNLLDYD